MNASDSAKALGPLAFVCLARIVLKDDPFVNGWRVWEAFRSFDRAVLWIEPDGTTDKKKVRRLKTHSRREEENQIR